MAMFVLLPSIRFRLRVSRQKTFSFVLAFARSSRKLFGSAKIFEKLDRFDVIILVKKSSKSEPFSRFWGDLKIRQKTSFRPNQFNFCQGFQRLFFEVTGRFSMKKYIALTPFIKTLRPEKVPKSAMKNSFHDVVIG